MLVRRTQWLRNGADIGYLRGNVGVGTTNPGYKLEVSGSSFPILAVKSTGGASDNTFTIKADGGFDNTMLDSSATIDFNYYANGNIRVFRGSSTGENRYFTIYGYDSGASAVKAGNLNVDSNGAFNILAQSGEELKLGAAGTTDVTIDTNGNVGIGTTNFGAGAGGVLGLGNATAPTSSPADMVQVYAEDVSGSSELKVRDEAGNITVLS